MHSLKLIYGFISRVWCKLNGTDKCALILIFFLTLLVSFLDVISIGMVIPFLASISDANYVKLVAFKISGNNFFIDTTNDFLALIIFSLFIAIIVIAVFLRLFLSWYSIKVTNKIGITLSTNLFEKVLYQPYQLHVSRNSSEVINLLTRSNHVLLANLIDPAITMITSLTFLILIFMTVVWASNFILVICILSVAIIYAGFLLAVKNKLTKNSQDIQDLSRRNIQILQESLGGFRDIILDGNQQTFLKIYEQNFSYLRGAQGRNQFYSASPRILMEGVALVSMVMIALYFFFLSDVKVIIPLLAAVVFAMQKSLPHLQQLYAATVAIFSEHSSIEAALVLLESNCEKFPKLPSLTCGKFNFSKDISIKNLVYRHASRSNTVLNGVILNVKYGSKVVILGQSGVGKSTLLDLMMGLLEGCGGNIFIDGNELTALNIKCWQKIIAHVPQQVFLSDGTIAENIAFGVSTEQIDMNRVKYVANLAKINDFIESLELGFDSKVGERGAEISGGQRQRIGIARALYKDAKVLFLDEATSALDSFTEKSVIEMVMDLGPNITVIAVTHRASAFTGADAVYELSQGLLVKVI